MNPPPLRQIWVDLLPLRAEGVNGGARPFILSLLRQLAEARPDAQLWCSTHPLLVEAPDALRTLANVHCAPLRGWGPWRSAPARAQLLFCPFGPPSVPSRGLPVVSTFYDLQVLAYPHFFTAGERRERQRHLGQLRRHARRIAAISHFSRQEGLRHGLDPGRLRVIPIQVPPSPSTSSVGPAPLGLTAGNYLLFPANLWPHKNHELLFTAFAMACAQGLPPQLQLVCTGEGGERREQLQQLCRGLQIAERVLLPGYVEATTLEALYAHSLAVVFPSLYEGFGMPVIEAMARRIPVCCSNSTALAEVAGDGALLIDPRHPGQLASAMRQLASDGELRQQLIERGVEQAQRYQQPAAMATAYWQLMDEAHRAGPLA